MVIKMNDGKVSVVIPSYNEEGMIQRTAEVISTLLRDAEIPFELLFVDDGSKDGTWGKIQEATEKNPAVRGISFSRNFGKESAIFAGLKHASGDCVVVIDCDLQHPPEKIIEMYALWKEGYEVVEAVKADRGEESAFHALCARCFYHIISGATQIDMARASDFKLLDRKAVNVLLNMNEKNAFFRALSAWIGFRTTSVEFEVQERTVGTTKWSTRSLIQYAVSNIAAFSAAPMQFITFLGGLMLVFSLVLGTIAIYQKIAGTALDGFTTVIVIQLFTGSIIMISIGIIGYYISKIYEEVKGRPKFIVSKTCGEENNQD